MWKRLLGKVNKQHGSATIEAVVGFTGFILVIFTILSLVNLCRAQMLISSAMDNAAKELSQYAYFYKMSGLQKFSESLGEAASVGKEDINSVIGSVDNLYSSMTEAISGSKESYTNIAEATKEGTLQWSDIETAYSGIQEKGENINASVDGMMNQFEAIGDNPMAYMKSLVAIAGSTGLDLMKSHLIAAPLAKMFVRQQFGGKDFADQNLKNLGVKDGLEGMNFKMSSMFTTQNPDDICLVVFYELELIQLFDMDILSVKLCKQSRCGAWLGGDNVQEFVDPTKPATATGSGDGQTGSTGETTPGSTDTTEPGETTPGSTDETQASTQPTESTEPTEEKVDTTGSYWALDSNGKYAAVLTGAYGSGVGRDFLHHLAPVNGVPIQPTQSTPDNLRADNPKQLFQSYTIVKGNDDTDSSIYIGVLSSMKAIEENLEAYDTEDVERTLYYEVYVPDNISEEDYKKLEEEIEEAKEKLDQSIDAMNNENNTTGMTTAKNVDYEIRIIKSGGNYDYSSGGTQ